MKDHQEDGEDESGVVVQCTAWQSDARLGSGLVRRLQLNKEEMAGDQPSFIEDLDESIETIVRRKITEHPSGWQ